MYYKKNVVQKNSNIILLKKFILDECIQFKLITFILSKNVWNLKCKSLNPNFVNKILTLLIFLKDP
jgi:hypothetical protein